MFLENFDNIFQLLTVISALLIAIFHYISGRNRVWLFAVGVFTGDLLSCYFWTAYYVIMGDDPNSSSMLTNLGWNISFLMLVFLIINTKEKEELKFFHPLMLLPIPLNIWQFILYIQFGGILNNIYEVGTLTVAACLCIQSVAYYVKKRKNSAKFPFIAISILALVTFEFCMWTFSCFDGWIADLYYPSAFLCSLCNIFLVLAISRTYKAGADSEVIRIDSRMQSILKTLYFIIVLVGSAGGILLGYWIKDMIAVEALDDVAAGAYDIIFVIMFLISIIIAVFAIVVLLIVYFEQKNAENNSLREARLVAERSNAAKSDFLANMSHEIRTPINAVLGMNKMIMRESRRAKDHPLKSAEETRKVFADITGYSANIENAGNNLLSIINDILDFSKIEAGKFDIIEREYMLSSILNDVSNTVLFKAKDKGLDYRVNCDASLPDQLFGDEMRIRQVVTNILNNAVKYTDKGSVTLTVSAKSEAGTGAGATLDLVFAVSDTGIGIKEEDRSRLFGKFERMDLERNSTVEGTGLGLAITQRLLTMMNGTIDVESEYGKGSVFTIHIPQKVVSAEPIGNFREKFEKSLEEAEDNDRTFKAPEAHILIVDDTRMNLSVAVGLLKDTEIKVDTAESGAEALNLVESNTYDMILLDQRMPGMDGTQTLHKMREIEACREVPVICLTADAISGAKERYVEEGFNDYLSKPIDIVALYKILINYLPADKVIAVTSEEDELSGAVAEIGSDSKEASPAGTANAAAGGDPYSILNSAGIDTVQGLGYCGNDSSLYEEMLTSFIESSKARIEEMNEALKAGDMKDYGIKVHSLKSTSRMIGALELSEMAAASEKAANEENAQLVRDAHEGICVKTGAVADAVLSSGIAPGAAV